MAACLSSPLPRAPSTRWVTSPLRHRRGLNLQPALGSLRRQYHSLRRRRRVGTRLPSASGGWASSREKSWSPRSEAPRAARSNLRGVVTKRVRADSEENLRRARCALHFKLIATSRLTMVIYRSKLHSATEVLSRSVLSFRSRRGTRAARRRRNGGPIRRPPARAVISRGEVPGRFVHVKSRGTRADSRHLENDGIGRLSNVSPDDLLTQIWAIPPPRKLTRSRPHKLGLAKKQRGASQKFEDFAAFPMLLNRGSDDQTKRHPNC